MSQTLLQSPNLNMLWAGLIIEELVRNGIDQFIVSPGFRSAPLAIALSQNPRAQVQFVVDERAAAFVALGYGRSAGKPAVLLCTSGSAATHYYPAVIEASQAHVPMLLLTADRPPELLDCGASQAIQQSRLYGAYVNWHKDFPCPSTHVPANWVLKTVDQALQQTYLSSLHEPGPVHLNIPFREPLAPTWVEYPQDYLNTVTDWLVTEQPWFAYAATEVHSDLSQTLTFIHQARSQGILVLGQLKAEDQKSVLALANKLQWPVLADILSGLRLDLELIHQISSYDQLFFLPEFEAELQNYTFLHIGGGVVSGRLMKWLEKQPGSKYLQIRSSDQTQDPYHHAGHCLSGSIARICTGLQQMLTETQYIGPESIQVTELERLSKLTQAVYQGYFQNAKVISESLLGSVIAASAPSNQFLLLGNSMCVREIDAFASPRTQPPAVWGIRPTSGIEGHVAAAIGLALGRKAPVTLICGDLTLFHDLNSLYLASQSRYPVTIIVVNNQGGGIFQFLPLAQTPEILNPWFTTPQTIDFAKAAELFGLAYHLPLNPESLLSALEQAWTSESSTLIEIQVTQSETFHTHRELQALVREQIQRVQ